MVCTWEALGQRGLTKISNFPFAQNAKHSQVHEEHILVGEKIDGLDDGTMNEQGRAFVYKGMMKSKEKGAVR